MIVKRQTDPADEDHSDERHPPVDWRTVAPRWFLLAMISALFLTVGWLIGINRNLADDRLARMEKYQSDARWDLLTRHSEELTAIRMTVNQHGAQLEKLAVMAEDVRVLRRIAESQAARRRRSDGGYGL